MKKLAITDLNRLSIPEFKEAEKLPLVMVLDNVRSRHNVGAVFRTADAFRAAGMLLCGITPYPPSPEIHKTALGAEDSVEWRRAGDICEAVKELKARGYRVAALEQAEGSTMLDEWQPLSGEKYAIILGNEVTGVAQEAIDLCDECIEIPQFGTKHSLNVSVAGGLVMWEFAKLRFANSHP